MVQEHPVVCCVLPNAAAIYPFSFIILRQEANLMFHSLGQGSSEQAKGGSAGATPAPTKNSYYDPVRNGNH